GVGSSCAPAGVTRAGGQENHRFARSRGCAREGSAVAKVFDIERDRTRRLVLRELVDQLCSLHVRLVAERCEPREAEPLALGEQRDLERHVAALRDQPDLTGWEVDPGGEVE